MSTNFSFFPPPFAGGFGLARRAYAAEGSAPVGGGGMGCAAARAAAGALHATADLVTESYQAPTLVALRAAAARLNLPPGEGIGGGEGLDESSGGSGKSDQFIVYAVIPKQATHTIRQNGLQRAFNQMITKRPVLEDIFEKERLKRGITTSRTSSIYAYPQHPSEIRYGLSFNPETDEILEVTINPTGVLVANGEYYTEAALALEQRGDAESAREWAVTYWETAVPLDQYQEGEFTFPEVLIPYDVSPIDIKSDRQQADDSEKGKE